MITEIALLEIKPGSEPAFEAAMKKARDIIRRAKGCKGVELMRSIEKPNSYRLLVLWESRENNTVDFRTSSDYKEMGRLVRDYLAGKPAAEHFNPVAI
jgi:heme-degrading monooxygenase HmoA